MARTATVGRLSVEMVADTVSYVNKMKEAEAKTKQSQKKIRDELKKTGTSSKKSSKDVDIFSRGLSDLGNTASLITGPLGGVASRISSVGSLLTAGGGVIAGVGLLTAGFTAMVIAGADIAEVEKQMGRLAKQSRLSTIDFLAYQSAYETVQVSGEQLADQTKDLQDRLGEYGTLASGPFRDFVDIMKISKEEGMALARSLTHLSGPEVFQELYNQMDKAGKSGSEMVFVFESLGNDASKLIPLLADGGSEMKRLNDRFKSTNTTMEQGTVTAFSNLSRESASLWRNLKIVSGEAVSPLINRFEELAHAANVALVASSLPSNITAKIDLLPKDVIARQKESSKLAGEASIRVMQLNNWMTDYLDKLDRGVRVSSAQTAAYKSHQEEMKKMTALQAAYHQVALDSGKKIKAQEQQAQTAKMNAIDLELDAFFEAEEKKSIKLDRERKAREKKSFDMDNAFDSEFDKEVAAAEKARQAQLKVEAKAKAAKAKLDAEHKKLLEDNEVKHQEQLKQIKEDHAAIGSQAAVDKLLTDFEKEAELHRQHQQQERDQLKEYYENNNLDNVAYLEAKSDLEAKHAAADAQMKAQANDPVAFGAGLAGLLGQAETFAMSQLAISQALAIGKAFEMGPIAGAAATVGLISTFASLISSIKGGGDGGQFHSGTDNVSSEGSYLLSKGERVVQPKANKDLTSFLNNGDRGGSKIESSLVIQGNVTDEKWFAQQLNKQQSQIAGIVSKQQRKYPTRS